MATKRFTFKAHKPTGRYRSFDHTFHDIKLGGKKVGGIEFSKGKNRYQIRLMVKDETEHCGWKNIFLKYDPTEGVAAEVMFTDSVQAMRCKDFLHAHFNSILQKYPLHAIED